MLSKNQKHTLKQIQERAAKDQLWLPVDAYTLLDMVNQLQADAELYERQLDQWLDSDCGGDYGP